MNFSGIGLPIGVLSNSWLLLTKHTDWHQYIDRVEKGEESILFSLFDEIIISSL